LTSIAHSLRCGGTMGELREKKEKYHPMQIAEEEGKPESRFEALRSAMGASEIAMAAASWATCSISMTLLNKVAVGRSHAPIAVVIVQMLATVGMAAGSKNVHFGNGWRLWALAVPPLFALMMVTSMIALQYVTVGTFVVVRNLGPIVTLLIESVMHKPETLTFDWRSAGATGAIALGVFIYEAKEIRFSEIRFSGVGLIFLIANLGSSCAERMMQRHLLAVREVDVSKPALMILNNGLGALFSMLVLIIASPQEMHSLYHALKFKRGTGISLVASCVVGCLISYAGLWLQRLVTATSFMVLGSFTKMIVIAYGIVMLGDSHGFVSVFGAVLSLAGSYAYSRIK